MAKEKGRRAYTVNRSAVRRLLKDMRASDEFFKELEALIARRCKRAIERAKGAGRKTLRGIDV